MMTCWPRGEVGDAIIELVEHTDRLVAGSQWVGGHELPCV